jgi:hypothetical protein
VNRSFTIVRIPGGRRAAVYSIKFDGEPSEFYKFVNASKLEHKKQTDKIVARVKKMSFVGLREDFFETYKNGVSKLKRTGQLRLYALRFSSVAIVLGSGGFKDCKTYQEDPILNSAVELLEEVDGLIAERRLAGDIKIDENGLSGNLRFELEDYNYE